MTAQLGLLAPTEAELRAEETDTAERSDDPTPRGVIRAVLEAAGSRLIRDPVELYTSKRPFRVLDVCAGYGAWASEFRRWWDITRLGCDWPVHITGVELLAARERHLRKWCDEAYCPMDLDLFTDYGSWDIAIGNPHFPGLTHENPELSMPAVLLGLAPAVLLLHTQQAFLKSEAGRAAWRLTPPAASWLVPGSVKFRTGINPKCSKCGTVNPATLDDGACSVTYCVKGCGAKLKKWGADSRCYQVTLWLRGHTGPCSTHMLPELEAEARRWRVPPGSEEPSADLPAAPGWTP